MDVAEQIVVMNEGAVEQTGRPLDLYEHPSTEFVMSFIGPVARLGVRFVRPHDVEVSLQRNDGSEEALIERIVHLGFETRVETALSDGSAFWVQLTKTESDLLELREGQIVYLRPRRAKTFDPAGTPRTEEMALA